MRGSLLLVFFLASACQFVGPMPAPAELCATNADCAEGLRCEAGACVAIASCVPDCSTVECGPDGCGGFCGRCDDDEGCRLGRCVTGCRGNATTCPAGCNEATNTCGCASDPDCGDGAVCVEGACAECRTLDDCGEGGLCFQGRCVACGSDASCAAATSGSRPFCAAGSCEACRANADCAGVVEGLACIDGVCGCSTDLDCGGDAPVCASGVCDDCKPGGCAEGLVCVSGVGCRACAGSDADCVALHGEGATCGEDLSCVCPAPDCTDRCGTLTTSCGTEFPCGGCDAHSECVENTCIALPGEKGDACDDAECGAQLKCIRRSFAGSSVVGPALRGLCLGGPPCGEGTVLHEDTCYDTCSSDDDCAEHAFCATDLKDDTLRYCAFGCRFDGSCGEGKYCDPYARVCLPATAQSGGHCDEGTFCREGEACLAVGDSAICVPDCTTSSTDCLCLHGATGATGACQPSTGTLLCNKHGDCGLQSLCVGGTCGPACVVGSTTTLSGEACDLCPSELVVFDEGDVAIATCQFSDGSG